MIRHLNKKGLLLLLLLLAAAGATTWLRTRPDITGTDAAAVEAIRQIDFFMENFRIRQYDEQGQLHYIFMGRQLNHFPEGDRAEISEPDLALNSQDKRWTVRADRAVTAGEVAAEIRFLGNVRMQRQDNMLIRTEALLLKPETKYMETLQPVVISGAGSNIEAASLQANLQTGMHTLTAVKGRYAP
jgi:LPS export ABC transporter protein LptC